MKDLLLSFKYKIYLKSIQGGIIRVYIETYGCTLNQADSMIMRGYLEEAGVGFVDGPDDADVIIVNTCVVRKDTEEKMIKRLSEIEKLYSGAKKIVVAGCMVSSLPASVKRVAPSASLVTPQTIDRIVDAVFSRERAEYIGGLRSIERIPIPRGRGVIAPVPISEGCLSDCSFCITKISRGRVRSYPPRAIVNAIKDLVSRGYREIELASQDSAVYGFDIGKNFLLPDLVEEILEIDGDYMIRIGMMNPQWLRRILDRLIEVIKHPKVYKFLHIPVQSGDNRVLRIMKRGYTVEEFEEMVSEIRRKIPEVTIATDIVVGHPGEDEKAFRNTLDLMERMRFDRVHLAQYSVRPLTEAAAMPQVPEHIKKRRSIEAQKLQEKIGLEIHREYIGKRVGVLTTEKGMREGTTIARTTSYRQVVIREELSLGMWIDVEISDATFFDLRASRTHIS
ncbi:MAG: tRNA (N(6)-L-threonylcarbamoyladenosine(37)-C(2))-methylthiotransferase [Desulfurococcales archaeon]|nr:tRNA (N(6)-L-threonylcarbamoyladenosine(37)-C(2))-methylthiotransferase [Desulfurococcales archaeon]